MRTPNFSMTKALPGRRTPAKRGRGVVKVPDSLRPVLTYVDDVTEGRIVAGDLVRLTCERHKRDVENRKARWLYFDADAADRALRFFPRILRHSKGEWAGQPL